MFQAFRFFVFLLVFVGCAPGRLFPPAEVTLQRAGGGLESPDIPYCLEGSLTLQALGGEWTVPIHQEGTAIKKGKGPGIVDYELLRCADLPSLPCGLREFPL